MELLAFFIWFILACIIPLGIIFISYLKHIQQVELSKVIFRFFKAIVVYVPVTLFSFIYFGGLLNAMAHKHVPSLGDTLFCFATVVVYGVLGYLLWSFVNGGFIKPWLKFSRDYRKPQSIFNAND